MSKPYNEALLQRVEEYLASSGLSQNKMAQAVGLSQTALSNWRRKIYNGDPAYVPFPVSWTVKMKKKQKETQDILSYHSQAAGCSDKARAKASGGRQPIEECGRTGL